MEKKINPSFTRGEYWLLETVVEHAVPIGWLYWEDLEIALNKPGHGMKRLLLVETMQKLFSDELLMAHRSDHWDDCLILSAEQIETALNERQRDIKIFYCLTAKGGEYWEVFASPEWNKYIKCEYEFLEDNGYWAGDLACTSKEHLESYFQSLRYHHYNIDENSIQWDVIKPWKATYWKELPISHRVQFHYQEKESNIELNIPKPINQLWYDKLWYNWR